MHRPLLQEGIICLHLVKKCIFHKTNKNVIVYLQGFGALVQASQDLGVFDGVRQVGKSSQIAVEFVSISVFGSWLQEVGKINFVLFFQTTCTVSTKIQ